MSQPPKTSEAVRRALRMVKESRVRMNSYDDDKRSELEAQARMAVRGTPSQHATVRRA